MKKRILVVAAHPDDEMLGCGGTVAKLIGEGHEAHVLILGEGVTSRDTHRNASKRKNELSALKRQVKCANRALGIKEVFVRNFPDNRFDSVPLLDLVKAVEEVKNLIRPEMIFTHFEGDLNIDHQMVFNAVLTATRPMANEPVKEIYSFEIPSSTDWRYPLAFSPDVFFDITSTIKLKLAALSQYKSEMREFPHPRSLESIELIARYWGSKVGGGSIEAFKTIRVLR